MSSVHSRSPTPPVPVLLTRLTHPPAPPAVSRPLLPLRLPPSLSGAHIPCPFHQSHQCPVSVPSPLLSPFLHPHSPVPIPTPVADTPRTPPPPPPQTASTSS